MSTSIMIHDVTSVRAGDVTYSNANSVTIEIQSSRGDGFSITVFDLPRDAATYLSMALQGCVSLQDEAAIRADERAKVTARLAALIGEAA